MPTTATSELKRDFAHNRLLQALALLCVAVWAWAAVAPVSRSDWLLENLLLFAGVGLVAALYLRRRLSELSYLLIAAFFLLHTVGAHYTYSEVPLGRWLQSALDLERNHYDRVVHFLFGLLLAYPVRELILRTTGVHGFAAYVFPFAAMVASSEIYELIEWLVASLVSPEDAIAFLGTQGDVFDAQKDTALALIGTTLALALTALAERRRA